MKEATKKLLDDVEKVHDWSEGRVYGGGGDVFTREDDCLICGMKRYWNSGSRQNQTPEKYTYTTLSGMEVSLQDAVAQGCIHETSE